MARLLGQYIPFSLQNRFEKVVAPKKFDKTYTVFVNEKDFLIPPDVGEESYSFFMGQPNFGISCELSRPESGLQSSRQRDSRVEKYIETIKENTPEVYSYYANITMLPSNFAPGSEAHRIQQPEGESNESYTNIEEYANRTEVI